MFRPRSEQLERERSLLNRNSLETCPPELRQSLEYVLHLRSHWKPEGCAKLVVPASWMEFLALGSGKCETECVAKQPCPFRDVRFDSQGVAGARLVMPGEELPREVVSRILTNFGSDDFLATLVPHAFKGIPHASLSDVPAALHRLGSQNVPWPIDFGLVLGQDVLPGDNARCLFFGMKQPTDTLYSPSALSDTLSGPLTSTLIPEDLNSHGQFHLTLLTSLVHGGAVGTTTESFPEWLILFGLIYDVHQVRIVACMPRRRKVMLDVIDCVTYVVDQLSLRAASVAKPAACVPVSSSCVLVVERLRLLLALMTLRRHILHLSKSLFAPIGYCDGIGGTDGHPSRRNHDQHRSEASDTDSKSLEWCCTLASSLQCSSEYSTCQSSLHARESNELAIGCGDGFSSSSGSFACTFCSTCSSSLESTIPSDSFYPEEYKHTNSENYMEPSTLRVSQGSHGSITCSSKRTANKRQEIIAWARQVIPTEHPIEDTYRMVAYHAHPGRRTRS